MIRPALPRVVRGAVASWAVPALALGAGLAAIVAGTVEAVVAVTAALGAVLIGVLVARWRQARSGATPVVRGRLPHPKILGGYALAAALMGATQGNGEQFLPGTARPTAGALYGTIVFVVVLAVWILAPSRGDGPRATGGG